MDELRETALSEYEREGPPKPLTWVNWVIIFVSGFIAFVFIEGLKSVFGSL